MKKILNETIIILVQLASLYLLPLIAMNFSKDAMILTVFINIVITVALSVILFVITSRKIKYFYPLVVLIIFIPSIFIFYNDSAIIYAIGHLLASLLGMGIGKVLNN